MALTWVTTSLILLVVCLIIMTVTLGFLTRFGEQNRARKATVQGIRWLAAGLVVAVISDTAVNGNSYELFLPATLALVILIVVEYYMLGVETGLREENSV